MGRASIVSGAPFQTACFAALIVWIITAVFGYAAYLALEDKLRSDLELQILDEELLLHEILREGGADAVQRAIEHLNNSNRTQLHVIALFDQSGSALAGSIAKVPDTNGWHEVDPDFVQFGGTAPIYMLHASEYIGYRTVVALSMTSLSQALTTLWEGLLLLTLATTMTVLGLGYYFSSQNYRKLKWVERTLEQPVKANSSIRLPVSVTGDQFDRIFQLVNRRLDWISSSLNSTHATAVTVARDLKAPLTNGFIALQQVYSEVEYGGDPRSSLNELESNLKRIRIVFDTILKVSQIEEGTHQNSFKTVNLSALVEGVTEALYPVAVDAGKHISADYNADTILIRGDENMLQQLLVNLVNNSLRYCPSGSWIRISVTARPDVIELVVTDNGPGVPEPQISKIFNAFFRAGGTKNEDGNGLGLSLVKAVATRHGAIVTVENNEPGLRVCVSFGKPRVAV
ncbi:Signal transduction histidine kinase [Ruegeria halocynthiae]|uniref:histidine kinase n=1 Tax=Ruegeria halocynthiae TaxID=985054 RepID=A0A1H3EEX9_9RHOB|nr:HAMP domain-containing sensor histidine kinase [Ruegeria halocynthiae]SDX77293.1 Signal transduction histidine kinase [Ruegeria halocynthiae]